MTKEEITKLVLTPCEDRESLLNWIRYFLGFHPMDSKVSRFATATPADMLWELYNAMLNQPYEPRNSIWIAARGHQKTASVAIFEILCLLHGKRNVFHLAAIEKQASKAKEWANKFSSREHLRPFFQGTNNSSILHCKLPDLEHPLVYEIAPASLTRVQGPRSNVLVIDEISVLKGEKIQAYKESRYIPVPTLDGKPYIRAGITSRRGAYTVTEQEIADSERTGLQVKFWTCLEGTKVCPESKHGGGSVTAYSDIYSNKLVEENTYGLLADAEKDKYDKIQVHKNCITCPAVNFCRSDLAKPRKTYKYMRSVDDLIKEFKGDEYDLFLAQMMSLQPSMEGIVFAKYRPAVHRISYNKMWEVYTGEPSLREVTEADLVKRFKDDGIPCYCGVDWGSFGADPCAAVYGYVTPDEKVFILRSYCVNEDPQMFLDYIWRVYHDYYGVEKYYCDSSQPATIRMMRHNWGFPVSEDDKKDRTIIEGITQMKRLIQPPSGPPKMYLSDKNTDALHEEMIKYHHETDAAGDIVGDEFADEWNHNIDASRYFISKTVSKPTITIDFISPGNTDKLGMQSKVESKNIYRTGDQYTKEDSSDFLNRMGIFHVDNRPESEKKGKGDPNVDF